MIERSTAGRSGVGAAADPLRGRLTHARLFFWAQTVGIVILLAVILTTPGFLSEPSILALLTTVSFIGCVAIGMTLITISGNIMSFALGATVGVTAMVFILAANWLGLGVGVLVGLVFGSLLTGLQGLLIGWVRANPIIVSIAALALIYGVTQAFSEKGTVYADPGTVPAQVKGKITEKVEFFTTGEYHAITIDFEDQTSLNLAIEPSFTLNAELQQRRKGETEVLFEWPPIPSEH